MLATSEICDLKSYSYETSYPSPHPHWNYSGPVHKAYPSGCDIETKGKLGRLVVKSKGLLEICINQSMC